MNRTAIGAVLAALGIGTALVVGVAFASHGEAVTPFVSTLIGLVGVTIPSLLALNKAETVHQELHNGTLKENIRDAVTELAVDPTAPIVIGENTYDAESELHASGVGGGDREEETAS